MKKLFVILFFILGHSLEAGAFLKDFGIRSQWLGPQLPGHVYQVRDVARLQKRILQMKTGKTDCEDGAFRITQGKSNGISWVLLVDISYCQLNMQRPNLMLVSVPGTSAKYLLEGVGHKMETITVETNPNGVVSWTVVGQEDRPEGASATLIHRLFFDDTQSGPRMPIGMLEVNLPDSL